MKKGRLIGCLALVASAFLWATAYIAVKQLVAEVPPSVLLAFRFSFAAIILAVIQTLHKRSPVFRNENGNRNVF